MLESTIESTFTSRDWHETHCAHCCEFDSCVSMADVPTCRECLEQFYDESGEPIELNVYQPVFDQSAAFAEIAEDAAKRIAMKNLAVQIVMLALGFLGGYLVTMAAFYGVAGGK